MIPSSFVFCFPNLARNVSAFLAFYFPTPPPDSLKGKQEMLSELEQFNLSGRFQLFKGIGLFIPSQNSL